MPTPRRYRVTVVSGTPAEAEASAQVLSAQTGAQAARVFATGPIPGFFVLPQFTTVMVEDVTPGPRRRAQTTYYLWLDGTVSRTRATRPTDAPRRASA